MLRVVARRARRSSSSSGNHDSDVLERKLARAGAVVLTRSGRLRGDGTTDGALVVEGRAGCGSRATTTRSSAWRASGYRDNGATPTPSSRRRSRAGCRRAAARSTSSWSTSRRWPSSPSTSCTPTPPARPLVILVGHTHKAAIEHTGNADDPQRRLGRRRRDRQPRRARRRHRARPPDLLARAARSPRRPPTRSRSTPPTASARRAARPPRRRPPRRQRAEIREARIFRGRRVGETNDPARKDAIRYPARQALALRPRRRRAAAGRSRVRAQLDPRRRRRPEPGDVRLPLFQRAEDQAHPLLRARPTSCRTPASAPRRGRSSSPRAPRRLDAAAHLDDRPARQARPARLDGDLQAQRRPDRRLLPQARRRDFGAWNEVNHKTQETWNHVGNAVSYFKSMYSAVAGRCPSCAVVGLDVLDQAGVDRYMRASTRASARPGASA